MKFCTFSNWMKDESGAVTVDWTVLAAAIVGLGIASAAAVRTGTGSLATDINNALSSASVAALGALGASDGAAEAAVGYAHELLFMSEDNYAFWLDQFEAYSDEDLASIYASDSSMAAEMISMGDPFMAGHHTDFVAAMAETITSRGNTVPEGSVSVRELDDMFQAMF